MKQPYVAIMAGGIGSRFWPSSRESRPKQFLDILGTGRSLIQQTYDRFAKITHPDRILVVTNEAYRTLVQEQLPDIPAGNILCEPSRNNTAPSVAYTALHVEARDPDASLVIAPSDHVILKEAAFLEAVQTGLGFAERRHGLVTLGISPTRPDTGYGYIQYASDEAADGVHQVSAFREKPDEATAMAYLDEGGYVWNAGIFIWTVRDILLAFEKHSPQIFDILSAGRGSFGTAEEGAFVGEHYPNTEKISVDYAIMERADNVYTIPCDIGWSDLGTWGSLHAYADKDDQANVVHGGNTHVIDSSNNLIRTNDAKLVVVRGLRDFIIVDEEDVLMIYPKSQEQEIKQLTQSLGDPKFM